MCNRFRKAPPALLLIFNCSATECEFVFIEHIEKNSSQTKIKGNEKQNKQGHQHDLINNLIIQIIE